jgi:hypothetical protein
VVLISHREGAVYPLDQPLASKIVYGAGLSEKSLKACNIKTNSTKLVKPASLEIWHQRTGHPNIRDLTQLAHMTEGVVIIKSNEDFFCETCTLSKQHKVHSKGSANHRSEILEERLHTDIFEGGNILSGVGEYRYDAVVIDDATRMKFPMTLRTKDEVCAQILTIFNQIENHTGRKIKFFRTNEGGEFQRLTLIINEKDII